MAEEIAIKNNIIIPVVGKDSRSHELKEVLEVCSDEKIKSIVKEAKKEEKEREKREEERKEKERKEKNLKLMWNTNAILNDLKENHIKIEEDKEMMWYKWKIIHIDLPKVWNFKWFRFGYFVSNITITKEEFERDPLIEKQSYSMKDVSELLQAMNEYMKELQGDNDWDMNYENGLRRRETNTIGCMMWYCLRYITCLNTWYWLKDKELSWIKGSRAIRACANGNCCFSLGDRSDNYANLFLKLSDDCLWLGT